MIELELAGTSRGSVSDECQRRFSIRYCCRYYLNHEPCSKYTDAIQNTAEDSNCYGVSNIRYAISHQTHQISSDLRSGVRHGSKKSSHFMLEDFQECNSWKCYDACCSLWEQCADVFAHSSVHEVLTFLKLCAKVSLGANSNPSALQVRVFLGIADGGCCLLRAELYIATLQ